MGEKNNVKKAVILAAGQGKRMRAATSKVLCEVTGKPMLLWVIDAARGAGVDEICVVASEKDVMEAAEKAGCCIREQAERLGTGHAVRMAEDFLKEDSGDTLVLAGDAPFMDSGTLKQAYELHVRQGNAVTVISAEIGDPGRYGRIIREGDALKGIVEAADCTDEQKRIREINSGAYWFNTGRLTEALQQIRNDNAQGEYYLTDAVAILIGAGYKAGAYTAASEDVVLGANDPAGLLLLNEIAARRAIDRHLENGVQFRLRDGVIIGPDVVIEAGAVILPGCTLTGTPILEDATVIVPAKKMNRNLHELKPVRSCEWEPDGENEQPISILTLGDLALEHARAASHAVFVFQHFEHYLRRDVVRVVARYTELALAC